MLTGITGLLYDLTQKLANVAPTTVNRKTKKTAITLLF